jgi:hypothetical protein
MNVKGERGEALFCWRERHVLHIKFNEKVILASFSPRPQRTSTSGLTPADSFE